jgi:hypothetical protein
MLKTNRKYLLLFFIFTFSFIYRMLLMLWNGFPSGADIGLHNSVIYSITGSGHTNFLYNAYQMGGGTSLTFPGYHIFTSSIILLTSLPEYIAHSVVVALFSALTVPCAFLLTKSIWKESAAFIVAFLVAISRFDIEMTLWGGYPNVITLMLIPLTFYLYLQKDRFSLTPFLASTSIIAGAIFLTHSLSSAIFISVAVLTVLLVFVSPKKFGATRKTGLYWLLPIFIGIILVSPFLLNAVPTYLQDNSSAPGVKGVSDINSAILSTRILSLQIVVPLFFTIAGIAVFSKKYHGRFLVLPTLLLSMLVFVPMFLTQGYLFGFIVDYNRFLYFVILPLLIFMALVFDNASTFFAQKTDPHKSSHSVVQKTKDVTHRKIAWLKTHLSQKSIYGGFLLFFLLFSFIALPIFMTPYQNVGQTIQSFYQVMNNPGWETMQWIKTNTPSNSVFVSDALYGWWLSGFAQRPTLSAVSPEFLTSKRELALATNASNLLDTDYLIDNGLIQVREDGGYIARHNPEIVAKLNWTYFPYTFFNFAGNETAVFYKVNGNEPKSANLTELTVKDMQLENDNLQATVTVTRGNEYFNYTQKTTIYKNQRFVNLTTTINSTLNGVTFDELKIDVQSKGNQTVNNDNRTFGMFDEPVKVLGQLIFIKNQPSVTVVDTTIVSDAGNVTQRRVHLVYTFEGKQSAKIQISASAYSVSDDLKIYNNETTKNSFLSNQMTLNLNPNKTADYSADWMQVFNYRLEMQSYNVSYIACRNLEMYPKFLMDPSFSLVFINSEVAIFKVNGNLNQNG